MARPSESEEDLGGVWSLQPSSGVTGSSEVLLSRRPMRSVKVGRVNAATSWDQVWKEPVWMRGSQAVAGEPVEVPGQLGTGRAERAGHPGF